LFTQDRIALLFNNQTWLVTGCAGFLGLHTCETLLKQGAAVIGLDNLDPYYSLELKHANLKQLSAHPQFTFIETSIEEPEAFSIALAPYAKALAASGGVVHLAARAGVRPSISEPLAYLKTNVEGTLHLLEWCREQGITNWVFASSSSVYGDAALQAPFKESMNIGQPVSPYAATKAMGEQLLHTYTHLHGFNVVCLRFFTVYGPAQRPDLAVHKFAKAMLGGQPIPVYGQGLLARDFTYCTDTVAGILAACQLVQEWHACRKPGYEVVNLGNSKAHTVLQLIEGLEHALGLSATLEQLPLQPGDVTLTCADLTRAKQVLAYQPKITFEEGLALFAQWVKPYYGVFA
jgi:UDP-glucuronate 4-epimerase